MFYANWRALMRLCLALTMALVVGGLLTACGDDSTGPTSIFGTYTLATVNGQPVPVEIQGFEITAGWIRLDSDSTYTISMTVDGVTPDPGDGTYTADGSSIEFSGDFTGNGTISGNALTIVDEGGTFVFRK
jgi:hypothetical protein